MASVFTYETDPVRVGSPWPRTPVNAHGPLSPTQNHASAVLPPAEPLSDYGISKLIPEPQEGPVEYKLHLLLRPRRSFSATSTVQKVSGSHLSKSRGSSIGIEGISRSGSSTPTLAPSTVSKQNRLQHLTTQLLWRLQQSSPYHSSSKSDLVLPVLPDLEVDTFASRGPRQLLAGLEESLGALYEIGVSDDGSLVGLTRDEIDESLNVLRAMSHSLGCQLQVLRVVDVGHCQWSERVVAPSETQQSQIRNERLWVAEVLVDPDVSFRSQRPSNEELLKRETLPLLAFGNTPLPSDNDFSDKQDCQLRVTLTGSTTSGKSSLLGTLSTSTLDNGRGKSRLSLLKHRHEIESGLTSSLAQELIGYHDVESRAGSPTTRVDIVNYSSANVSSWTDIHNTAHPGRLVFVTDSAGHPRYRRTTLRGVISWAPHWTLCCIAADDDEDSTGKVGATASANEILGSSGQGVDLSKVYLDLCLKLDLPLVIVITKYDLASKAGLRQTLTKVLSTLKDAGRKPAMLPLDTVEGQIDPSHGAFIAKEDTVTKLIASTPLADLSRLVPIVLTSAVTGVGISKVHSLLRHLPVLPLASSLIPHGFPDSSPLFHIDEVFTKAQPDNSEPVLDFIVSGYLRHGTIGVGDRLSIGPFTEETPLQVSKGHVDQFAKSYPNTQTLAPDSPHLRSISHRASSSNLKNLAKNRAPSPEPVTTWREVTVTSIRNLRLPVRQLSVGQVATVAIRVSTQFPGPISNGNSSVFSELRKGMVLLHPPSTEGTSPPAYSKFTALFKEPNTYVIPGSSVTVYIASIRASAKIIEVRVPDPKPSPPTTAADDHFDFDKSDQNPDALCLADSISSLPDKEPQLDAIEITFKFSSAPEWIELGTPVLVTPASGLSMLNPLDPSDAAAAGGGGGGGGGTGAGLDGFVGLIVAAA